MAFPAPGSCHVLHSLVKSASLNGERVIVVGGTAMDTAFVKGKVAVQAQRSGALLAVLPENLAPAPVAATEAASARYRELSARPQYLRDRNNGTLFGDIATSAAVLERAPADLLCPIDHELMVDAVVDASGHSYSSRGIRAYFGSLAPGAPLRSPLSGEHLGSTDTVPNHDLRGRVFQWIDSERLAQRRAASPGRKRGGVAASPGAGAVPPSPSKRTRFASGDPPTQPTAAAPDANGALSGCSVM